MIRVAFGASGSLSLLGGMRTVRVKRRGFSLGRLDATPAASHMGQWREKDSIPSPRDVCCLQIAAPAYPRFQVATRDISITNDVDDGTEAEMLALVSGRLTMSSPTAQAVRNVGCS